MIIFALIYAALLVGFYFCQRADARVSQEGFAIGYVEGNSIASLIFGKQPSATKLEIFNFCQLAVLTLPAAFFPAPAMMGWSLAVVAAACGRHLLAVREWRKAFATGGASLFDSKSAWQKFLGL